VAKNEPKVYTKVKIAPRNSLALAKVINSREWVEIKLNKYGEIDILYIKLDLLSHYLFHGKSDIITIMGKEIFLDDVIVIIKNHR
jgi:hypothetical protein